MNFFERALVDRYDELGLARVGLPRTLETAVLTPRFQTSRHVVVLVFAPGDRRARVVVKVPRVPGDNTGVNSEASMIRRLAEHAGREIPGVPAVLGTVDILGQTLLVETVVQGEELDPRRVQRSRDVAVQAGRKFIDALPVVRPAEANTDWYEQSLVEPLQQLAGHARGDIERLCARTHAVLERLRRTPVPAVFEHGDLSHPNLFLLPDGATLGVIDWERAREDGVPGHDLVFFVEYLSESLREAFVPAAQLAAFELAFAGPDAWAVPLLTEHLLIRGVDPGLAPELVVTSWARSAATLVPRLVSEACLGAGAVAEVVARDRDVLLWRRAVELAEEGTLAATAHSPSHRRG